MGVMLQAFYWDCPERAGCEFKWWDHVKGKVDEIADAGFTALWLPPPGKAASQKSMGFESYDLFDLGEYDQRGGVPTWFGTRASLDGLINEAHEMNMQVYVDLAINHAYGGDEEPNMFSGEDGFTLFEPASGRFPRNWECFHPSRFEYWDNVVWDDAPAYCHKNPFVLGQMMEYTQWLVEDVGFDGFCFDFNDGYGIWLAQAILGQQYIRHHLFIRPFGMASTWESAHATEYCLNDFNRLSESSISIFDTPLRTRLKALCDVFGSQIPSLLEPGAIYQSHPFNAVTFVDNHHFMSEAYPPVFNDKMLAYAFILTHPGYPCVFWEDYFEREMGLPGQTSGIQALVRCHEEYANGMMIVRHLEPDLYIMERTGLGNLPGMILVMNNRPDRWHGAWVQTSKPCTRYVPVAWRGKDDVNPPLETLTHNEGHGNFWAPPRGYAIYANK